MPIDISELPAAYFAEEEQGVNKYYPLEVVYCLCFIRIAKFSIYSLVCFFVAATYPEELIIYKNSWSKMMTAG